MIATLILSFAAVAAVQAQRIARERDRANTEAQLSKQITDFLTGLFSVSDPGESRGKSVTARELLDTGARQIETTMHDQPVLQARLMETIGVTYDRLVFTTRRRRNWNGRSWSGVRYWGPNIPKPCVPSQPWQHCTHAVDSTNMR